MVVGSKNEPIFREIALSVQSKWSRCIFQETPPLPELSSQRLRDVSFPKQSTISLITSSSRFNLFLKNRSIFFCTVFALPIDPHHLNVPFCFTLRSVLLRLSLTRRDRQEDDSHIIRNRTVYDCVYAFWGVWGSGVKPNITGSLPGISFQSPGWRGCCPAMVRRLAPDRPPPHPTNWNRASASRRGNRDSRGRASWRRRTACSPVALSAFRLRRRILRPSATAHRPPSRPRNGTNIIIDDSDE